MTVRATAQLGGSASDVVLAKVGHGTMGMTRRPSSGQPTPDAEAFDTIKAGLDQLPEGVKMLLSSGEFYGHIPRTANVELLSRFFEKYPEYQDKVFLSVKGGSTTDLSELHLDHSPENARRCVDLVLEKLRGTKKIDHYEFGRILVGDSVEENMRTLAALRAEGKFDHIGLSDCRAETVRRANAIVPITSNEIQVSPWCYTKEVRDAIDTCKELGITVLAWSPIGKVVKDKDKAITDVLDEVAKKNNISQAQTSIAWVASRGPHIIPLPGSSHKAHTLENLAAGDIVLPAEDITKINEVVLAHSDENARRMDDPHTNDTPSSWVGWETKNLRDAEYGSVTFYQDWLHFGEWG